MMAESDIPQASFVPTFTAKQRLERHPKVMHLLIEYLEERAKLEGKQKDLYQNFYQKYRYKKNLNNIMTSVGLPKHDWHCIAQTLLLVDDYRSKLHATAEKNICNETGPIQTLTRYLNSTNLKNQRERTIEMFENSHFSQLKLEEAIERSKLHYLAVKSKEEKLKAKLDSIPQSSQDTETFLELHEKWKKMAADAAFARNLFENNLRKEKATRNRYIQDMADFWEQADNHEIDHVKKVLWALGDITSLDLNITTSREVMGCLNMMLVRLEHYNVDKDLKEFRELYSYRHEFPVDIFGNGQEDEEDWEGTTSNVDCDTVQEIEPKPQSSDESDVLRRVQSVQQPFHLKANDRTQLTMLPLRGTLNCMPDVEGPNMLNEMPIYSPPQVKDTAVEASAAKTDVMEVEPAQVKKPGVCSLSVKGTMLKDVQKTYGKKTFSARSKIEISFKKGQTIYMTHEANSKGDSYGYVKKGIICKKKVYGFFPERLVGVNAKKKSLFSRLNPFAKDVPPITCDEEKENTLAYLVDEIISTRKTGCPSITEVGQN